MFCKNCGAKLDDDAVFCDKCGTAIKKDYSENETVSVDTLNSKSAIESNTIVDNLTPTSTKSGKKRFVVFIFAIVVVAAIVVAAILFLMTSASSKSTSDPRAESNFNNGAKLAYDDKALYFIGLYDEGDSSTCVYSTTYTGTNKTLISDNSSISKIRIVNEKILYEIYGDDVYTIGIMDKDGSNNTVIVEKDKGSDDSLNDFDVTSSTLYYLYNNELRTCTMDGADDTLLFNGVKDFLIVGNMLYYATDKSIFSYDIKKSENIEICSSEASSLVFDDGKIYFKNSNGIYSVAVTGDEGAQRIVKDSDVGNFVLDGDNIYYIQTLDTDDMIELAKAIDEDDYITYAIAMIGAGQIEQVSKFGGSPVAVDSDQLLSVALFVYPNGMYSKLSVFTNSLSRIEFE